MSCVDVTGELGIIIRRHSLVDTSLALELLEVKEAFDMNDELLSFACLDIRFNLAMGSAEHIYDTLYCARCQAADQDP
jgi:hypothetical protein